MPAPESSRWRTAAGISFCAFVVLLSAPRASLAGPLQLSDAFFALAAGCWVVSVVSERSWGSFPRALRPALLALLGYGAWAACSGLWSPTPRTWLFHTAALGYIGAIWLLTQALLSADARLRRWVADAWIIAFGISAVLGVAAVISFYAGFRDPAHNGLIANYGSMTPGNYPRVRILGTNPSFCGSYLLTAGCVAFALRRSATDLLRRALPWLTLAGAVSLFFTFTAAVGAVGVAAAVWGLYAHRELGRKAGKYFVVIGGAAALGMLLLSVLRFAPPGRGDIPIGPVDIQLGASVRISIWGKALDTFRAHPITGAGLGSPAAWVTDPRAYTPGEKWREEMASMVLPPVPMEAHNTYLSVLAQLGLVGFALFSLFVALNLVALVRSQRAAPERWGALATLLAALGYHGIFASLEENRHIWFSLGLAAAVATLGLSTPPPSQGDKEASPRDAEARTPPRTGA